MGCIPFVPMLLCTKPIHPGTSLSIFRQGWKHEKGHQCKTPKASCIIGSTPTDGKTISMLLCVYRYPQVDEMMHMNRNNSTMIISSHKQIQVLKYGQIFCLMKWWVSVVGLLKGMIQKTVKWEIGSQYNKVELRIGTVIAFVKANL